MRPLKEKTDLQNTFIDSRVTALLPRLEELATLTPTGRRDGRGRLKGWKYLASIETTVFKTQYPDNAAELDKLYSTCTSQITRLNKALRKAAKTRLSDPANLNGVNTIITHFISALNQHFSEYKNRSNVQYVRQVKTRSEITNRIEIDLTEYLVKANEILSKVGGKSNWLDVSCALALVTGRRMAEIHLSADFKLAGEYSVEFTGQLKGKARDVNGKPLRQQVFTIPTLVKAEYVVNALNWLELCGRRFDKTEDTARVNARFSKDLNKRIKSNWDFLNSETSEEDKTTYHKFRAAYLRASLVNAQVDPFDYLDFARSIMGDDDAQTLKAYQRYVIAQNTITRI